MEKEQCVLTVLTAPGVEPIRCRRRVWEQDPGSHACYSCHPRGREKAAEDAVRRVMSESRRDYGSGPSIRAPPRR